MREIKYDCGVLDDNGKILDFENKKFRLYNKDTGATEIRTLGNLINTKFRMGKYQYRGQYTGLKDKNGKGQEVYDKDVIKTELGNIKVDWINDGWNACWDDGGLQGLMEFLAENPSAEIIGNIYSNPKLIKQ